MTTTTPLLDDVALSLQSRIRDRSVTVGIIGQGYVGLPLALVFAEAGVQTTGFEIDAAKVALLARGESYIKHIGPERVRAAVESGRFSATSDFDRLSECDAILICVPTPLGPHREPDLGFVLQTADVISTRLRRNQLVVLESTTYPGTTDEEVRPRLDASGLKLGEDYLLAYSPEREDPGNSNFSTRTIPKIVGGTTAASTEIAAELYRLAIEKVVPVSSARVAESAKLLENIYRSVNIALVNELKIAFDRMGINVWEVIEAARTKPFGFSAFQPGPGVGGHCIPLDPFYLTWKAAETGTWTRFIELAGEINTSMPRYVISKVAEGLNLQTKPIRGSKVLVLGLSYKANIDDDRESPSYELLSLLIEAGADVQYCDPFFPVARPVRKHDLKLESVPCTPEEFARYDAIVVSTAHDFFKNPELYRNVSLVVDTRNIVSFDGVAAPAPLLIRA